MIGSGPWVHVHGMSREAKASSAQDENEGAEKAPASRPDVADATRWLSAETPGSPGPFNLELYVSRSQITSWPDQYIGRQTCTGI